MFFDVGETLVELVVELGGRGGLQFADQFLGTFERRVGVVLERGANAAADEFGPLADGGVGQVEAGSQTEATGLDVLLHLGHPGSQRGDRSGVD